jgi:coenzyme F420-reducing hydrogenase beta subunit
MISIINKADCCGCSACYNVCPKRCIAMKEDEEGFLYPVINEKQCIKCDLCEKICPELNVCAEAAKKQKGYIVQIKDEAIRKESTSGGAFTGIAQYILKKGGVVFGAAYNADLQVIHTYVEKKEDLHLYRNSKYVQSKIGDTFSQVKTFLQQNRLVCFSGTPCQIKGLVCYLRKSYANLVLVDVVCRAVSSPKVWNTYLAIQKSKYGDEITNIRFRDKYYGYKYSNMAIYKNHKICYHSGIESDMMLRAFFSNICDRPSCYACNFKKRYRVSDFTIWDCFEPEDFCDTLDAEGTTRVLIHTPKGDALFAQIKDSFTQIEIDPDCLVRNSREMFFSVAMHPEREWFFKDLNNLKIEEFYKKYFKITFKIYLERFVRLISYKVGIYTKVKKIAKSLRLISNK